MASLEFENIGKTFDEQVVAVANVSFDVADGEFVVLVGPSGCGKTTLLRLVAGLESLTAGTLRLDTVDVSDTDPRDRDIAMVFQNYALYPHMSVYENMAFGLRQRKVSAAEIEETVRRTARTLDLEKLLARRPGALSGGQKQRVAMGRAIVRNPAVFLMDEPLSNLDAKLRVQMRSELKLLRARLGVTTLYVTHDQVEAMTMGDRVAVMKPIDATDETNLQQVDTPQKLYKQPVNMFVASFIGSPAMNFVRARITGDGDTVVATIVDTALSYDVPKRSLARCAQLPNYVDRDVIIGIRPEFFEFAELSNAADKLEMEVDVLVTEIIGPDSYIHFDIPTPPVNVVTGDEPADAEFSQRAGDGHATRFTARVDPESATDATGGARIALDLSRVHYFDPATEAAIH